MPAGEKYRITSSRGSAVLQAHVGEHERFAVAAAGEGDAGRFAHGAVHAVGADDVSRAQRLPSSSAALTPSSSCVRPTSLRGRCTWPPSWPRRCEQHLSVTACDIISVYG